MTHQTERIAVISDIHGNLLALEAVLADIAREDVDCIVNLGDIVSGPLWPSETADLLMELDLPTIRGNHERQVTSSSIDSMGKSDAFAAAKLTKRHHDWLTSLPATRTLAPDIFCCHGTPIDDLEYFLETVTAPREGTMGIRAATLGEATDRAGTTMCSVQGALLLCGHTHVPRLIELGDGRLIVNPGSVGLQAYGDVHPYPHVIETLSPHARYALVRRRGGAWKVDLRCIPYDARAAARRAESSGRSDWADALKTGRLEAGDVDRYPIP